MKEFSTEVSTTQTSFAIIVKPEIKAVKVYIS
jgi:hypothetical protein